MLSYFREIDDSLSDPMEKRDSINVHSYCFTTIASLNLFDFAIIKSCIAHMGCQIPHYCQNYGLN